MTVNPRMVAFVATQHAGVLATVKRDGRPQLSNLFYAWDDDQQLARAAAQLESVGSAWDGRLRRIARIAERIERQRQAPPTSEPDPGSTT